MYCLARARVYWQIAQTGRIVEKRREAPHRAAQSGGSGPAMMQLLASAPGGVRSCSTAQRLEYNLVHEPEMDLICRERAGELEFEVRVAPRAARSALVRVERGVLHVRLGAPPVEGAANRALLALLAEALALPRTQIVLAAGERSRRKRVVVRGLAREELLARLAWHLSPDRHEQERGEQGE
jgi:uncharacterized protein (TIGR00251 family)